MSKGFKFLKIVTRLTLIVLAIFACKKLIDSRNINTYATSTEITINVSDDKFYYSKLDSAKKGLYTAIHNGISRFEPKIVYIQNLKKEEVLKSEDISDTLDFYMKDNPNVFYVSSKYTLEQTKVMHYQIITLNVSYQGTPEEIKQNINALEEKINTVIAEKISPTMTNYQKELTLHDYLLENTDYYYCEDIADIPYEKHTAYSALINKSCVCDGFSKAYSLLLDKVGIGNIVVSGIVDSTTHSWNLVNLDDEWYNVDVTSDNQTMDEKTKVKTHIFFNVTDEQIKSMYKKDNVEMLPECVADKYNYFKYNDYIISSNANIRTQLTNDANAQKPMEALEIMVSTSSDITQTLINTLYSMNFNNYKINGIKTIKYFKYNNIYIFPKGK